MRKPKPFSTLRSNSTPASDAKHPAIETPALTFLRATAETKNGQQGISSMTGVALLDRAMILRRKQNHDPNRGFPLHPSLKIRTWRDKTGLITVSELS